MFSGTTAFIVLLLYCVKSSRVSSGLISELIASEWNGLSDTWIAAVGPNATRVGSVTQNPEDLSVRIDADSEWFSVDVDIDPGTLANVTLEIWIKVHTIANQRGWVFGSEDGNFDRFVVMHDDRYNSTNGVGHVAMGIGKTWYSNLGVVPLGVWVHVAAVWRQWGKSYVYLNGLKSNIASSYTTNDDMPDVVTIGRTSKHAGHWVDCDIAVTRIYDRDLYDNEIQTNYAAGFEGHSISTEVPTISPTELPTEDPSESHTQISSESPTRTPTASVSNCMNLTREVVENLKTLIRIGHEPCFSDSQCNLELVCQNFICT